VLTAAGRRTLAVLRWSEILLETLRRYQMEALCSFLLKIRRSGKHDAYEQVLKVGFPIVHLLGISSSRERQLYLSYN
jgi:hypothetical protein